MMNANGHADRAALPIVLFLTMLVVLGIGILHRLREIDDHLVALVALGEARAGRDFTEIWTPPNRSGTITRCWSAIVEGNNIVGLRVIPCKK